MNFSLPAFTTTNLDEGFKPEDESTKELYAEVAAFARQGQPVLIFGPTGSGKEFLARHYYCSLTRTEFYEQYRENWPDGFKDLINLYSKYYSEKELKVFADSLRAGVYQSINSSTIYPHLAESLLFGHEENSFTDAKTRPGLVESIKYGVLFLDEIGELSKDLQAKFLRAVDSEIAEGRRVAGKMDYTLKDLIIIAATNRPRDKIRKDFYYKIGIDVEVKGIDERPKDLQKSIPYFIAKALGKRKDYASVTRMFGLSSRDIKSIDRLSEAQGIKQYSEELGKQISDLILSRKWPGNFRAVRRAIESSVMRIESIEDTQSFSRQFRKNIDYYVTKYSDDNARATAFVENYNDKILFPSAFPGLDRRIYEELTGIASLHDLTDYEKNALSVFLSSTHESGFSRKQLGEFFKNQTTIRYTSDASIRNKINRLQSLEMLLKTGRGKSTMYHLATSFMKIVSLQKIEDIFSVPQIKEKWHKRSEDIKELSEKLQVADRIYIKAPIMYGKTSFIALFCEVLKNQYNFYYYPLGEEGITKLFRDMSKLISSKNIKTNTQNLQSDPVISFKPNLNEIFKPQIDKKPVLILDNANYVGNPDDLSCIARISDIWEEVILILSGDKMDNTLEEHFIEFPLMPWDRGA